MAIGEKASSFDFRELADLRDTDTIIIITNGTPKGNAQVTLGTLIDYINSSGVDLSAYMLKSGGSMTGPLVLNADASNPLSPVTLQQLNAALTGLWDDRGNYDASGNVFPSSGGSGTAGAILKGDIWTISVAGTLGGVAVTAGYTVRAIVDSPGSTLSNWAISKNDYGYTPLSNTLNSARIFVGNPSNIAAAVALSLSATPGVFALSNAGVITFPNADNSTRGLLSSTDWSTFNSKETPLAPTAVKTSAYTAAANELVPVDTTSGNVVITLPNAPTDKTRVAVKHVTRGGTNTVTINCAGSDVYNKTGGATSAVLTLLAQGVYMQYNSSLAVWYIISDDLPLSQLDSRYVLASNSSVALTSASTINITGPQHSLSTALGAITFTISYTGDDILITVILTATSSVFTFLAGSWGINSDGTSSGNNTVTLGGVSGDKYVIALKKDGSNYGVIARNVSR